MKDNLNNILTLFEQGRTEKALSALRDLVRGDDSDEAVVDAASREWSSDNLIVDHDAVVSYYDDGAWVSAWVHVDLPNNKEQA